jgi:hypothetical protein
MPPRETERNASRKRFPSTQFGRTMGRRLAVGQIENASPQPGSRTSHQGASDADFRVVGVGRDYEDIERLYGIGDHGMFVQRSIVTFCSLRNEPDIENTDPLRQFPLFSPS